MMKTVFSLLVLVFASSTASAQQCADGKCAKSTPRVVVAAVVSNSAKKVSTFSNSRPRLFPNLGKRVRGCGK